RAETIAVAEEAPEHHAATVARKELHVLGELWKATVSDEILLNVGDVQRRELLTALADVVADRRKSMPAGGVADDGDEQLAGLEALHELEGILRRQVIRLVAGSVLLEEQLAISRVIGARRTSDARVAEVERIVNERITDSRHRLEVQRGEGNAKSPHTLTDRRLYGVDDVA